MRTRLTASSCKEEQLVSYSTYSLPTSQKQENKLKSKIKKRKYGSRR